MNRTAVMNVQHFSSFTFLRGIKKLPSILKQQSANKMQQQLYETFIPNGTFSPASGKAPRFTVQAGSTASSFPGN